MLHGHGGGVRQSVSNEKNEKKDLNEHQRKLVCRNPEALNSGCRVLGFRVWGLGCRV